MIECTVTPVDCCGLQAADPSSTWISFLKHRHAAAMELEVRAKEPFLGLARLSGYAARLEYRLSRDRDFTET